jgi:catechol 2,3-dioxygenase-like lactoylglutathione lyase family enzyme
MNLNQVTLPAKDLNVSIAFYETLGLQLIVDAKPRYARLLCPEGKSTLSLHLQTENIYPSITLYFETAELDAEYERLQAEGITFNLPPTAQTWGWREAHLEDPDGHKLILFWAGEYRINPPWRINK